jgi:hypothetical protein
MNEPHPVFEVVKQFKRIHESRALPRTTFKHDTVVQGQVGVRTDNGRRGLVLVSQNLSP